MRGPCRRCGSKACLIYKGSTLTKICNIMTKRPSSLYTEPRQRRLPETHMNIVNKQTALFSTTTTTIHQPLLHHQPPSPTTVRLPTSTTTTWQATSPANGRTTTMDGDDLARQRTCHIVLTVMTQVVVTVQMNAGEPPSSFIHTKSRSHVAVGDISTNNGFDNDKVSNTSPPLLFHL